MNTIFLILDMHYLLNASARLRISADSKGGNSGFWLKNKKERHNYHP